MERASFVQTTYQSILSFSSLPPKPHLREPPIRSGIPRSETVAGADRRFGRCVDDAEISIFDAERYYNEGQDGISRTVILDGAAERCNFSTHRRDSSFSSTDGCARHGRTCSSEASWNSQSGLLSHPPGSVAVAVSALPLKEPAKPPSFPARRLFGRNCPCYGGKSVDVDGNLTRSLLPAEVGYRLVNSSSLFGYSHLFSFPVLNPSSLNNLAEEPPRESLEDFRPTRHTAVNHRSFTNPAIPNPPPDDDVASDTSSDLFEIESFSTQTTYRRSDSLDSRDHLRGGLEAEAPPPSNAPGEASVEWSVTTAEGFDRRSVREERERCAATGGRRRCSGLLRCRSEEAVSVGPIPLPLTSPVGSNAVPKPKVGSNSLSRSESV
ncbi:protein PHYTOCHROME KINASE SUBSTRATE [Musa troglodytarum]|uniref:Protein PHYTOCHROME KINASE SUBSTRATE n=1 Tax=Musa troglodytarum TaxID=320322 RepID=A0A9E7KED4_9LILI|nr:protein PHYTOCHROME KINASE SUBSTRATE [Musa troglodytarum]